MVLSNIFREPRREITESAVGIAVTCVVTAGLWIFACWFQGAITGPTPKIDDKVGFRIVGIMVGLISSGVGLELLFLTHWMGEEVCEVLRRHGLELRPKVRR